MSPRLPRTLAVLCVAFAPLSLAVAVPGPATHAVAATYTACGSAAYGVHRYAPGGPGRTVALTFDDGPGGSTRQILDVLTSRHVEASFFNLGIQETQRPGAVRIEHTDWFALGGHTWDHTDLTLLGASGQAAEIDRERTAQAAITGAYPCLFRPPYGNYDATTLRLAQERGMRVWLWSVDPEDWKAAGSADRYWVDRIVARAEAGAALDHPVILLHNQAGANPATVAALPTIISFYRARGYTFVDLYGRSGHPGVTGVHPVSGTTAGGTRVTVDGWSFRAVQAVRFGAAPGRAVVVLSRHRLLVTAPPHAAGRVHVRVVTIFGTSPATSADLFRYVAPG